jgi:dihydroorotase-like cyclic amidohydrolase
VTRVVISGAVCPPGPPGPGWVAIDDGLIVEVGAGAAPAGALDAGSALLAPGFVDVVPTPGAAPGALSSKRVSPPTARRL